MRPYVLRLEDYFRRPILTRTFWYSYAPPQRSATHTHTLKPSPAGVLPGEAAMSLLPSLSGVSVSCPPGGIPSFLILLVLGVTARRSTPLDLSTVIILTFTPQHLHPSYIPNFMATCFYLRLPLLSTFSHLWGFFT